MNTRALVFGGSILVATLWIALLTMLLSDTEPGAFVPGLLLDRHTRFLPYPLTIQNVMWVVFFIGAGELFLRWLTGSRESEQLGRELLPEDDETMLRRKDLNPIYEQVRESDPHDRFLLQRLLTGAIRQFQSSGSTDQVNAVFNSLVELYNHETELRYNLLRYLVWLIPTLGFVGTVLGIALALQSAGVFFAAQEAAEAGRSAGAAGAADPVVLMQRLTRDLGVAFYTTLLALLQSAVLMAVMYAAQSREEGALNRAGQYCMRNLVNRLYE